MVCTYKVEFHWPKQVIWQHLILSMRGVTRAQKEQQPEYLWTAQTPTSQNPKLYGEGSVVLTTKWQSMFWFRMWIKFFHVWSKVIECWQTNSVHVSISGSKKLVFLSKFLTEMSKTLSIWLLFLNWCIIGEYQFWNTDTVLRSSTPN